MPPIRLRATSGALVGTVNTNIQDAPISGAYSNSRRYVPIFPLPLGVTYNSATGRCEGYSWSPSYTPSGNEVLLADQGSTAANRLLLQTTIDNAGSDAVRIRLGPLAAGRHWGDEVVLPTHDRVGVGMSIEAAGVKDGSVGPNRVTRTTAGLAPFRFAKTHPWGSPPAGNAELRSVIRMTSGSNVRLVGLDIQYDATWAATLANLTTSPGVERGSAAGLVCSASTGSVDRILLDRCLVMGAEQKPLLRGIFLNGTRHGAIKCWIDNVHYRGNDSQGYLSTDGAGPMLIEDCYIAVAFGESWMTGGGTTTSALTIPSNIIIRRNHIDFPQRFIDRGYETKNGGEWKVGDTSLHEGNVLSGFRMTGYDGQNYALVAKAVAQAGGDIWNVTRNLTIRLNEFRDCANTFGIGGDSPEVLQGTDSVDFSQNRSVFTSYTVPPAQAIPGAAIQISTRSTSDATSQKNFRMHHCTVSAPKAITGYRRFLFDTADQASARVIGLQVYGNALVTEEPVVDLGGDPPALGGYFGRNAGGFNAQAAWNSITDKVNCLWDRNAVVGPEALNTARINGAGYGDTYYASQAAAGLTAFRYRLSPGSGLLTGDVDGGMQGCDHTLVDAALAGVEAV